LEVQPVSQCVHLTRPLLWSSSFRHHLHHTYSVYIPTILPRKIHN
jgi:hypothetical protein